MEEHWWGRGKPWRAWQGGGCACQSWDASPGQAWLVAHRKGVIFQAGQCRLLLLLLLMLLL